MCPMNILLKNYIKDLQVWNYRIGINNKICKKVKTVKKLNL